MIRNRALQTREKLLAKLPVTGALHRAVVDYASAAILVVGTYWFVSRAFS